MIRRLIQWFLKLLGLDKRFKTLMVDELPERPRPRTLYVMGNAQPWSAALLCPCGCESVIHLSLIPTERPSWKVFFAKDGSPTLTPSVCRTNGCGSHFFLREGRILWCGPTDVEA